MSGARRQRVHLCGIPGCTGNSRFHTGPTVKLRDEAELHIAPEPLPVPTSPDVAGPGSLKRQRRVVHEWGAA